jgi:hypothetical protein
MQSSPDIPLTMRSFLFDDPSGVATSEALGQALSEHGLAETTLRGTRRLAASAYGAVDERIGALVGGLLEMDLGDALVTGWRRYAALVDSARRTLAAPGTEEVLALATHRVAAEHRPHVDLLLDGVRLNSFEFMITCVFDLTGVAAVVRDGDLVALRGGSCLATVTLCLEGARLARRQQGFDPGLVVRLPAPVPLIAEPALATQGARRGS